MSSGKKMIGASATHAAASEFLFRGYNIAFPEFDMGIEDDLLVLCPDSKKVTRVQVRSKQTATNQRGEDGFSTPVITPIELIQKNASLDYVVIALRYCSQWILGLFDEAIMRMVMDANVGSYTGHVGQSTFDPRARVVRATGRVLFSGVDVSRAFSHISDSNWDENFPIRISDVKRPTAANKEFLAQSCQRPDIKNSLLEDINRILA